MVLYLGSNTRLDVSFYVYQCAKFSHNIRASHETDVKRIFLYIKGTKFRCLVFNPSKRMVVVVYVDGYFAALWEHDNNQDHICDNSWTVFVITFPITIY